MQVTSTLNTTNAKYVSYRNDSQASIGALQNAVLTELPGVAFAVLTLVYIVSSLIRL
jgi:hypothetical protein